MRIKKPVIITSIIFLVFGVLLVFSVFNQNRSENTGEEWKAALPVEEWEATLFIMPEKGTFIVDEDLPATLNVDTDMEINAASGKIHFPVDKLEVIGLSKEESIFSLWVIEPFYSNTDGTILFAGGSPTPGFKGNEGKILTITFRAKKEGKADLKFEEGLVLANDWRGTDVLKELKGASFVLIDPTVSDLNNDGYINIYDLNILLSNWGPPKNPKADINKDGKVDIADFSILLCDLGQQPHSR